VVLVILLDNTNRLAAKQQLLRSLNGFGRGSDRKVILSEREFRTASLSILTNMGMESSEREVACRVQDGCLCFDLRSIFSYQSAIVH
jgi:hypothetical protein